VTLPEPPGTRGDICKALDGVYLPEGVRIWLSAPNPMLDGEIPNDLIERGDTERVMHVVEMLTTGAYG